MQKTTTLFWQKLFPILCLVLTGFFLMWHIYAVRDDSRLGILAEHQFPLLSKSIANGDSHSLQLNFADLHSQMADYLDKQNTNYSFYFQFLPNGASVKLGQKQELIAASLMKLPWVMTLYKGAEMKKLNLDSSATITDDEVDTGFGDDPALTAGKSVSLRQAAKLALQESNNTAVNVVEANVKPAVAPADRIWRAIDTPYTMSADGDTVSISAENYSDYLECLYFSCYLNKEDSQAILNTMTQTDFNNRLPAGVPKNVKVAHKIGTYSSQSQSDCGIVYYDQRNYLFCLMIDMPEDQANDVIAGASKIVYDFMAGAR